MTILEETEYSTAIKTVSRAKTFFLLLVILCLLIQIVSFLTIRFYPREVDAENILSAGNAVPLDSLGFQALLLYWAFPISKIVGFFSAIMLVFAVFYASLLTLLVAGKGTSQLVRAFLWSGVVLLLIGPWQRVFEGQMFVSALFDIPDLALWSEKILKAQKEGASFFSQMIFYARFLGYPVLTLIMVLLVQHCYATGVRKSQTLEEKKPQPLTPL